MKITKEKLLSLVKQNINEMPMDFSGPDRPSDDIQQKLQADDTPLSKIPLPKTNVANQNFQELLASERYRQVVNNVRNYTNFNGVLNGQGGLPRLLTLMYNAHNQIIQIERNHREELEQLAIQIVKEEMGLSDDDFNFDAKIIGQDEFDISDFNREQGGEQNPQAVNVDDEEGQEEMENIEPETIEIEEELYVDLEQLNLERAKRRLINSIIQGASKKGHYMYQLIPERLQQITGSDSLINLYGIMMSVNDANYWQLDDETIRSMGNSVAGKVKLNMPNGDDEEEGENESDGKSTIQARGVNFPVLVHELIKGVLEALGTHGQTGTFQNPQDVAMTKKVMELEDTLEKELWDLRLGPAIWDRIRESFPEEVLLENGKELQNYLFMNIFKLPAKEFLVLMREVISNSDEGKNLLSNMLDGIKKMLNDEEYEEAMGEFNNNLGAVSKDTDEESLMDELRAMGFDLGNTKEDDDEESDEDFLNQFR
jgi:hypothetical protein